MTGTVIALASHGWQWCGRLDRGLLTVVVVAALLCFTRYRCPLQEPQEARYAEIPRQMLAQGQVLVPTLHGQPYYDKPPLLYWLVLASYSVFGVHDWAARLVSCSAAFLCVLAAYAWGRKMAGPRAALLGALMLVLAPRFVQLERMVTIDSLLCLWVVLGWAAGYQALAAGVVRWNWWLLSALACGLGLLTKGPVALVLVLPPLLALPRLEEGALRPTVRQIVAHVGSASLLAAPWFLALAVRDPDFLRYFFWLHHVERFVAPFDHEEPFWFYLPVVLGGMLPWTLLLPGLVIGLVRRAGITGVSPLSPVLGGEGSGVRGLAFAGTCPLTPAPLPRVRGRGVSDSAAPKINPAARPAGLLFCLTAAGWCLLFFSLAGCKRAFYVLPAMPPLALALGCYFDAVLRERGGWSALAYWQTVLATAAGLVCCLGASRYGWLDQTTGLLLAGSAAGALVVLAGLGRRWRYRAPWAICPLATFVVLLVALHQVLPGYARQFSLRGLVRRHAAEFAQSTTPVICYPRRWDSVSFYLQRNDVRVYTPEQLPQLLVDLERMPNALLFIKPARGNAAQDLLRNLPPGLVFQPCGRQRPLAVGRLIRADEK